MNRAEVEHSVLGTGIITRIQVREKCNFTKAMKEAVDHIIAVCEEKAIRLEDAIYECQKEEQNKDLDQETEFGEIKQRLISIDKIKDGEMVIGRITSGKGIDMEKLNTIQKRNNLNEVYVDMKQGPGNGHHRYKIVELPKEIEIQDTITDLYTAHEWDVQFQEGPRNEENSISGVLDQDLLEIVRDRMKAFQEGPYHTHENEMALQHIEEALLWLSKRADDRAERHVLGTTKV